MKHVGYLTLLEFNHIYFTINKNNFLNRIEILFDLGSIDQTIDIMINHTKDNMIIDSEITRICMRMLQSEIRNISTSSMIWIDLLKFTLDNCCKFGFQTLILMFHSKVSFLSQIIFISCCVRKELDCSCMKMSASENVQKIGISEKR